jgi:hypothetical protein
MRRGATLYERVGDLPMLVLAAVLLAGGLALAAWQRARVRSKAPPEEGVTIRPAEVDG